jgi:hypothetical protein
MGLLTRGRFGVVKLVALQQRPRNKQFALVMSVNDTCPGRTGRIYVQTMVFTSPLLPRTPYRG